jgi:hypothetical protein
MPWGGYYMGGGWVPRRIERPVSVNVSNPSGDSSSSKDSMLIGGAVALGVVALVAIVYGASRKA